MSGSDDANEANAVTAQVDVSHYCSPLGICNRLGRLGWSVVWQLLFRPSPRICFGWRRFLLRCFGAKIGQGAHVYPSCHVWAPWNLEMGDHSCLGFDVDCYTVDRVRIGAHATVSQYSFLCTAGHDISDPHMRLVTAPITIGDGAWVCARAFVGPGVEVGDGAVVAACAVAVHDVPPWTVVAGNPARKVKERSVLKGELAKPPPVP
jgi:putative colanic acid biosynthesis acetyltransferase WcaF